MHSNLRIYQSSFVGHIIFFSIRNSLIIFLLLSILLVIISKSSKDFSSAVGNVSVELSKPFFVVMRGPMDVFVGGKSYFFELSRLTKENKKLRSDNNVLREEVLQLTYLASENKILKDLLKYNPKQDFSFVTSRIFINSSDPFSKLAVIDHGQEDDNIRKGQAIITSKGLVGRIIKTNMNHSHILLLNDFNSKIPVYTSDSGEKAIMVGRSSKYPILQYLNPKHKVASDEIIYTSGDGLVYPSNIPVGITLLNHDNQVEVIPFVNFNRLKFVKVIM